MTPAALELARAFGVCPVQSGGTAAFRVLENSARVLAKRTPQKAPAKSLAHSKRFATAHTLGFVLRLVIEIRPKDAQKCPTKLESDQ